MHLSVIQTKLDLYDLYMLISIGIENQRFYARDAISLRCGLRTSQWTIARWRFVVLIVRVLQSNILEKFSLIFSLIQKVYNRIVLKITMQNFKTFLRNFMFFSNFINCFLCKILIQQQSFFIVRKFEIFFSRFFVFHDLKSFLYF